MPDKNPGHKATAAAYDLPYEYVPIIDRPKIAWPNGARVAVWIVPNIEHFHFRIGDQAPDVRNFARKDYGNRVGIWRVIDLLDKYRVRGTVALNAEVALHYPRILEECAKRGWEFMGHGLSNSFTLAGMSVEAERGAIAESKRVIESLGQSMRGWLGPGLTETWNTLAILKSHDVRYVADWCNDDLPYAFNNGMYSIPYTLELNDMPLYNQSSVSNAEYEQRIRDSFDTLYEEGERQARIMCIAIHPFLIGTPGRIRYLDRALRHICSHDQVWLATGSEIINAFCKNESKP